MSGVGPWSGARPPKSSPEQAHHSSSSASPSPSPSPVPAETSTSVSSVKVPPDTGQAGGSPSPGAPQGTCLVASGPVTVTTIPGPGPAIGTNGKKYFPLPATCNGSIVSGQGKCSVLVGGSERSSERSSERMVEDDDVTESDNEVSKIHFSGVNMRLKKKHDLMSTEDSQDAIVKEEPVRPMSWEGELSDTEMMQEDTSMEGVQVSVVHNADTLSDEKPLPLKFGQSVMDYVRKPNSSSSQNAGRPQPSSLASGATELPLLVGKLLGGGSCYSPVLPHRPLGSVGKQVPPNPSPDSAIHSAYSYSSPTQSPVTSRHSSSHGLPSSGFSSPYTPSLSRNNSDASQYGGSQHSSCYSQSYSSVSVSPTQFSPTHSPIQGRHMYAVGFPSPVLNRGGASDFNGNGSPLQGVSDDRDGAYLDEKMSALAADLVHHSGLNAPGISRQQLINSPCPICGDKISGFHYGIFSCESCKGFFKRTVQNRKNYVCMRGSTCPVTIATRKKCPACRFEKCLRKGMKLEAIREDRTRGGRSTYQISYTLPAGLVPPDGASTPPSGSAGSGNPSSSNGGGTSSSNGSSHSKFTSHGSPGDFQVKLEVPDHGHVPPVTSHRRAIPPLLEEIMEVERFWLCNDQETQHKMGNGSQASHSAHHQGFSSSPKSSSSSNAHPTATATNSSGSSSSSSSSSSVEASNLSNLTEIADDRLYKIVKWCKNLPVFKNISVDDQIALLLNAWCELLLLSCCFRSMRTPGEIRVGHGKSISLAQAQDLGLRPCIERMLNFTEHLRRLRVDEYEYVAMKVIVLVTSDVSDLSEPEKVRASQEKALQALQQYTSDHYPDIPSKFGELLLRIPDLQRTCQVGKEILSIMNEEREGPSFHLLMELLGGDH
ncbi:nuclear hormone receptor FTZ-F1 beta isoform X2 [Thrips palmi]|uniref:Nuclear hormone receptor FTZ-F1 beta isoform X2 n=1 Tax=Thrips palmi TaxID=161013 RepID=A0A6P8YC06_THRPL|nr:nuclear hormone receptor FTZ-F1 beta isoform X2 [Thrips palmi]